MAFDRPCGMPVRPPTQLGQAVVHAHRRVLQAPPGEDRPLEHVGAGAEVVGVVDHRGQGVDDAGGAGQGDGLGFGRAPG